MPFDITSGHVFPTREEAAMRGLLRFWTGHPCKFGHLAERYVCNRQCVQCNAEKSAERDRKRRAADPTYRMFRSVQNRSGQVLKGQSSPSQVVGCSQEALGKHLEAQFSDGMTWDRYGQWEVDHIIPLSAARSLDHLIELCHYTNLQPLWKRDNLAKGGA